MIAKTHDALYYSSDPKDHFFQRLYAQRQGQEITFTGGAGDGFCFDTNSIHSVSLNGSEARHVAIFEFHDEGLERSFRQSAVRSPPFG